MTDLLVMAHTSSRAVTIPTAMPGSVEFNQRKHDIVKLLKGDYVREYMGIMEKEMEATTFS